jgi:hypothetical protein
VNRSFVWGVVVGVGGVWAYNHFVGGTTGKSKKGS